jgi:hypothetical protein
MATTIPVTHCPPVDLVALPTKAVTTFDNQQVSLGTLVYFRFGAGPTASEYAVVSGHALKETGGYKIAVVGPSGIPGWLSIKDVVKDKAKWWAFYQKHYVPTAEKEEPKLDVKRPSRARKRPEDDC